MWWYQSSFFLLNSCGGILRSSNTPKWSQMKTNTGWWFESLWKILVSWDYYYQYMENMFQTTNQNIYFPPCPTNIHHRRIQPFTKFRRVWLTPLLLGKFPLLKINHGMGDKNRWMWVNWSIIKRQIQSQPNIKPKKELRLPNLAIDLCSDHYYISWFITIFHYRYIHYKSWLNKICYGAPPK